MKFLRNALCQKHTKPGIQWHVSDTQVLQDGRVGNVYSNGAFLICANVHGVTVSKAILRTDRDYELFRRALDWAEEMHCKIATHSVNV